MMMIRCNYQIKLLYVGCTTTSWATILNVKCLFVSHLFTV
jgi:hypothetical protein